MFISDDVTRLRRIDLTFIIEKTFSQLIKKKQEQSNMMEYEKENL